MIIKLFKPSSNSTPVSPTDNRFKYEESSISYNCFITPVSYCQVRKKGMYPVLASKFPTNIFCSSDFIHSKFNVTNLNCFTNASNLCFFFSCFLTTFFEWREVPYPLPVIFHAVLCVILVPSSK